MACCVFMAALFGAAGIARALLTSTRRGRRDAREWRLFTDRKDGHG
jgi:hypothetical protein